MEEAAYWFSYSRCAAQHVPPPIVQSANNPYLRQSIPVHTLHILLAFILINFVMYSYTWSRDSVGSVVNRLWVV